MQTAEGYFSPVFKTVLLLGVFYFLFVPAGCHAALSSANWYSFDPPASIGIDDGGVHGMPFNQEGGLEIYLTHPDFNTANGELFFVPDPDSSEREFVASTFQPITWTQPGVYELDVYGLLEVPTLSPFEKFFVWLLPSVAHAQGEGTYIETLRFTITEAGPPCCSSVLFLPGIKGSALKEGNNTVWPPSIWSEDVSRLALTEEGESVNSIQVTGVLSDFYTEDVYGGFATFMDSLTDETGDGTIYEWFPFAYDWRLSPSKIIAEGVSTPDGITDLVETVENLASNSKTGKVAIVGHSMGGLMGKALIKELENRGEENLIDTFVMVGTPQLGTPQGVASLLHGDDEGILSGVIVDASDVRQVAQNMESAYNLLPSTKYFNEVSDPVITFSTTASFTQPWRNQWGDAIDSFQEFREFVTGLGVVRPDPSQSELQKPEILRSDVFDSSNNFHETYDSYVVPSNIRVVQVVGWGVPTVKNITYKDKHIIGIPPVPMQGYVVAPTKEGDSTVVYPSALSSEASGTYFFNLATYNELSNTPNFSHKDLLSAQPIQNVLLNAMEGNPVTLSQYIVSTKPNPGNVVDQLLVSTHSPVILGARDSNGNFTGINPNQSPASGFLSVIEDIPNSYFLSAGGDQYIFLPKDENYTFEFKGTGTGPATVEIGTFTNDTVTPISTYTDIPVTPATVATFTVSPTTPQETFIQVDTDGDGQIDVSVTPDGYVIGTPTLGELIATLKAKIQSLDIKQKLKDKLLKKVEKIEKKIAKQKNAPASKVVANLEKKVLKKAEKGKITDTDVEALLDLLEQIEGAL